jgi:hypothetical protein
MKRDAAPTPTDPGGAQFARQGCGLRKTGATICRRYSNTCSMMGGSDAGTPIPLLAVERPRRGLTGCGPRRGLPTTGSEDPAMFHCPPSICCAAALAGEQAGTARSAA